MSEAKCASLAEPSPDGDRGTDDTVFWRLAAMFGAVFLIFGVQLTYLPVWLSARGLTPAEIAFATAAPMFLRLAVTPTIAFLADRAQSHRAMIQIQCLASLLLIASLTLVTSSALLIALVILATIAVQSVMPLTDTIAMKASRQRGLDYGRIRLWGSATFILASYAAGFAVVANGPEAIIWLMMAGGIATAAAALMLPRPAPPGAASSAQTLQLRDVLALARGRSFVLFLICSGAIQGSHAMFYVFGVLHWRGQGLSAGLIGTLWAISVLAEIALFWAARRVAFIGPVELMLAGGVLGMVRWAAMAFDPPVALLVPLQLFHAGTYAATHLGAMNWIARNVPEAQAGSAQALLATFTAGVASGLAMLASGPIYASFAGGGFLAMSALAALGVAAGAMLRSAEAGGGKATASTAP